MSLQSAIDDLKDRVLDAYDALEEKGATMPATKNTANLPTSIGSIVELKGETKTITPTTSQQTINPSSGKNGITQITVNPVTSSIDANIVAGNIKKYVSILGVTGDYEGSGGGGGGSITVYIEPYSSADIIIYVDGNAVFTYSNGSTPTIVNNASTLEIVD